MSKTVNEIYSDTKAKFFEKTSSTIYDAYLISNLNRVLMETFEENNMERMWNGKKPFAKCPLVTDRTDVIEYEDTYLDLIIPLGLAAYFLIDDDLSKYSIYITDYKNARIMNQKMLPKEVIDELTSNA